MNCLNCGSQMAEGSKFCIICGAKAESSESVQETASQEAAVSVESAAPAVDAQPVPKPVIPQPVQQPAQPVQQVSQPKPAQSSFTQPVTQQPAQTVQQPYANAQQAIPQPVMPQKPEKITPLPVWKYIGIFLIGVIFPINIIMVFVWAFGNSFNRNTKNYARAVLITFLIFLVLSVVGYFTVWANIQDIIYNLFPNSTFPITN